MKTLDELALAAAGHIFSENPENSSIVGMRLVICFHLQPLADENARLREALQAIHDFWGDCAENASKGGAHGACLSPSATIMDSELTIAEAVSRALAGEETP